MCARKAFPVAVGILEAASGFSVDFGAISACTRPRIRPDRVFGQKNRTGHYLNSLMVWFCPTDMLDRLEQMHILGI